ncbi:MAG: hypothetical protein WKF75_04820 [Singulisphaera sp.]
MLAHVGQLVAGRFPGVPRFALLADDGPAPVATLEGGLATAEHAAFVAELAARREAPRSTPEIAPARPRGDVAPSSRRPSRLQRSQVIICGLGRRDDPRLDPCHRFASAPAPPSC